MKPPSASVKCWILERQWDQASVSSFRDMSANGETMEEVRSVLVGPVDDSLAGFQINNSLGGCRGALGSTTEAQSPHWACPRTRLPWWWPLESFCAPLQPTEPLFLILFYILFSCITKNQTDNFIFKCGRERLFLSLYWNLCTIRDQRIDCSSNFTNKS